MLEDVFRGGGGGMEDEGSGSGETESEDCSLGEPFALRLRFVIEFRFRLITALEAGE